MLCFPCIKQGWPSSMLSRWCCLWIQRDGHPAMRTTIWRLSYVQLTRGGMTRGPLHPVFRPWHVSILYNHTMTPWFGDISWLFHLYIYIILRKFATSFRYWNSHLANMFLGWLSLGSFLIFFDLAWDRREVRRARVQLAWDPNIWVVVSMSFPITCAHALHSTYHKQT